MERKVRNAAKALIIKDDKMLGESLLMVYLTGSYARGDANTSIPYDVLEINTQSLSVDEIKAFCEVIINS